jgi:hypothetical protein
MSRDSETLRVCSSGTAHSEVLEVTLDVVVVFVFVFVFVFSLLETCGGCGGSRNDRCEYSLRIFATFGSMFISSEDVDRNLRKRMLITV